MVLHPSLSHRESTQDVDYLHRSFVSEYRALGFPDAGQRLRTCIAETAHKFVLGADWMNDHADVALPWALECVVTLIPPLSDSARLNVLTIWSSIPDLQPKGSRIRPDLPRLDISPKRSSTDDLQRAWPRARRGAMAVGGCAQARALHEAGPGGLCCGATSRRRGARHPLDARWARAMDHGALPADGLYGLPTPAEAAASAAHTGCAQSGVSAWVTRYACVAHDERDLPVSLAAGTRLILLRAKCCDPTPDVGLFSLPCAPVFAQAVAHVSYLTSLPSVSLASVPLPSAMLSCHTVLIVSSHFLYNQGQPVPSPSDVVIPQTKIASYMVSMSMEPAYPPRVYLQSVNE